MHFPFTLSLNDLTEGSAYYCASVTGCKEHVRFHLSYHSDSLFLGESLLQHGFIFPNPHVKPLGFFIQLLSQSYVTVWVSSFIELKHVSKFNSGRIVRLSSVLI